MTAYVRAPLVPPTASTSPPKNHLGMTGKSIPSNSISTSFAASTGMCEEACPCDAIELTPFYEVTGMSRQELIFDKTNSPEVYDQTIEEKPM